MIFASTPPINDDPKPIVRNETGHRYRIGAKMPREYSMPFTTRRDPRPEFDRPRAHEANPLLVNFREMRKVAHNITPQEHAAEWVEEFNENFGRAILNVGIWTAEQINHARRVLTRLANFS